MLLLDTFSRLRYLVTWFQSQKNTRSLCLEILQLAATGSSSSFLRRTFSQFWLLVFLPYPHIYSQTRKDMHTYDECTHTHTNKLCCSYCEVFPLFNLFNYALYSLCPARSLAAGPAAEIWMFLLSFNLRTSRHREDPLLLFGPFFTLLFWCATTSQGCASPSSEHNQHRPGGVVVRLLLFRHSRFLSLSTWSWIFTIRGSLDTSGALCRRFRTLPTAFDSLLGHDFGLCALAPRDRKSVV